MTRTIWMDGWLMTYIAIGSFTIIESEYKLEQSLHKMKVISF